jgi:integrase
MTDNNEVLPEVIPQDNITPALNPIPRQETTILSRAEILAVALGPGKLRHRALFTILYLSNCRVSEIMRRLKKKDIITETIQDTDGLNRPYMLFTNLYTAKNRQHPLRNIPVNILKEQQLADVVNEYLAEYNDEDILFDFSIQRAWQIIKKLANIKPHILRHSRLTHLVTEYGLSDSALKRMAGWSDTRMSATYTHLNWRDIARMM